MVLTYLVNILPSYNVPKLGVKNLKHVHLPCMSGKHEGHGINSPVRIEPFRFSTIEKNTKLRYDND